MKNGKINLKNYNVAFDFDDSIADTWEVICDTMKQVTGKVLEKPSTFSLEANGFTLEEKNEILTKSLKRWGDIQPIPGSIEFMQYVYEKTKKPLRIITFRAKYVDPMYTYKWLDKHLNGTPYEVSFPRHTKVDPVKQLNIQIVFDDQPKIIESLLPICEHIFVMDQPWNRCFEDNEKLTRFTSWSKMFDFFE